MMLIKVVPKLKSGTRNGQFRWLVQPSLKRKENLEDRMLAWQIHSYGGLDDLKLSSVRIPVIARPTDVLIKVQAASINPLDIAMTNGYGATLLNAMRKARNLISYENVDTLELPLTLGRDFSGIVVSKGHGVSDKLNLGDQVWGVVPVDQQGCHAHYVIVDGSLAKPRPQNLSHTEAASILYSGLTAWSALWITGGLCYKTSMATKSNRRVLVLGGSGGVGTIAVQLLKAWNMHVITTCNSDAVDMVKNLGADVIVDYKQDEADSKIISEGPYDIILDCCNQGPEQVKAKGYPHHTYITLNSPLLKNIDQFGLFAGMAKNINSIFKYNIPKADNKSFVKWGFFMPSETGIDLLHKFVESGDIKPVIQKVYSFQELPIAYERVKQGHLRGKLVIDVT